MSDAEHTPGPWKVDSKYCVGPVSQEDDQSYGMIIPVADVYGPNIQADAELIASAPQLREQNRVLREAAKQAMDLIHEDIVQGDKAGRRLKAEAILWNALTATSQPQPPYKEWCRHPEKCAGLASCPQDPTCAD